MSDLKIAIIGLGYVGLPLMVEFSKKYQTIGFDISSIRVNELKECHDRTMELDDEYFSKINKKYDLKFTSSIDDINECNIYIVTVPTPIDKSKRPVLGPLLNASKSIGSILKQGDIVIYESTVYPGATEEDCVPILEKFSGLRFNVDFFCGYSPERINPGDKIHTLTKIKKVTSGSNAKTAKKVNDIYASIITEGTHMAPSIKVAEAAKVIENSQRDVNIAFVNELSIIFNKMGIDTNDVLEAANTKWNFMPFKPGLVGGHCIGVDPYYLTHKAQELGYNPEILLAGRRLNDSMGAYVAKQVIKVMIEKEQKIEGNKVLVMGITFKENCPDIRNSKVIDMIEELKDFGTHVSVYDPLADPNEVKNNHNISLLPQDRLPKFEEYGAIILAVPHDKFSKVKIRTSRNQAIFDVKGDCQEADASL